MSGSHRHQYFPCLSLVSGSDTQLETLLRTQWQTAVGLQSRGLRFGVCCQSHPETVFKDKNEEEREKACFVKVSKQWVSFASCLWDFSGPRELHCSSNTCIRRCSSTSVHAVPWRPCPFQDRRALEKGSLCSLSGITLAKIEWTSQIRIAGQQVTILTTTSVWS